ncbi:hypothetical protein HOP52_03370 [Halomonas campisalis]|uniref:Uncharacterized protein n=1 Tax=Billgrantia campisalis TaxID=74661 RepID=A0ABS9P4V3_9GAMM|nr:hypothetical protein [Halomonas campisalis]MCG6656817.1 hypothetical protein [Halomonas campisalis]MDR5862006.1 hypothetical protein [Halomonas campisalis]
MGTELSDFEHNMRREIDAFLKPDKGARTEAPKARRSEASRSPGQPAKALKTGHVVKLAVRTRPLERDTVFEHRSTSISKLEAQLEAEKAARKAGFPIIGHLIEIQRL